MKLLVSFTTFTEPFICGIPSPKPIIIPCCCCCRSCAVACAMDDATKTADSAPTARTATTIITFLLRKFFVVDMPKLCDELF
jgi:hypothetical protein